MYPASEVPACAVSPSGVCASAAKPKNPLKANPLNCWLVEDKSEEALIDSSGTASGAPRMF